MSAGGDGSESVDDFLARIASVREGRDEAGELEIRRREEEILKNRKERQARRAERARSLSPSKTGPAQITSTTLASSQHDQALNPPVDFSPSVKPLSRSNAITGRISPTKELDAQSPSSRPSPSPERDAVPSQTHSNTTTLSRSGTLSWQQRPVSRDGPASRQGLSSNSTTMGSPSARSPIPPSSEEISRKDIAASLAQKDPNWFRQTQDRGLKSAAYRKNQVEDSPTHSLTSGTMQLPGMAQQREPSKSPKPESRLLRTASPAQNHDQAESDRYRRGNTPDIAALRKSMVVPPSQKQPAAQTSPNSRPLSMISTSNTESTFGLDRSSSVLSSDRPVSPTKGLGGFVESAMMKRSDSVKRWSVKADTGLRRGDSVAGGRPAVPLHSRGLSRDIHIARDASPSSPLALSKPESDQKTPSHSPDLESSADNTKRGKDSSPSRSEAAGLVPLEIEVPQQTSARPKTPQDDPDLARSPSKTMDPRRWSPTKSTWLESALQSKAEPPKLQPLKEDQPKWKVDLQRSRSRASRDISPNKGMEQDENQNNPTKPLISTKEQLEFEKERPLSSLSAAQQKERPASVSKPANLKISNPQTVVPSQTLTRAIDGSNTAADSSQSVNAPYEKKEQIRETALSGKEDKKPPVLKPKPQTPPKTDFRATLKSRALPSTASTNDEPEFKAMFGKLKRATTQNYVAPDELKTNILTGKAALNTSAGPQKVRPVDEFKDSLLAKKDEMKTPGTKFGQRVDLESKPEPPLPEALARRKTLSKASAPNLRSIVPPPVTATKPQLPPSMSEKAESMARTEPAQPEAMKIKGGESREISPLTTKTKSLPVSDANSNEPTNPLTKVTSLPGLQSTDGGGLPVGSKLASRLNPNIMAVLSRSSSPKPLSSPEMSTAEASRVMNLTRTTSAPQDDDSESLTHMTKGRAKGPRRRAPKADAQAAQKSPHPVTRSKPVSVPREIHGDGVRRANESKPNPVNAATPSSKPFGNTVKPRVEAKKPDTIAADDLTTRADTGGNTKVETSRADSMRQKPTIANKSPELKRIPSLHNEKPQLISNPKVAPSTPPKPAPSPAPKPTVKEVVTTPNETPATTRVLAVKDISPKVKTSRIDTAEKPKGIAPVSPSPKPSKLQGLGLGFQTPSPSSASKTLTKPRLLTPPPKQDLLKAPKVNLQQVQEIISDYVGVVDKEQPKADFNAQQFLVSAKDGPEKVKRKQYTVFEMTGGGKRVPMPPRQEHILFEESMYLITHNFINSAGTNVSEVYLWHGDQTSDAAVEDAQLFCKKEAREHNTKLEVVKQGKESTTLIEALGGILITRRSKSSSFYMLCGRRHLGQIVFDEVEMTSSNLCPGFVYLISAQFGKFYLWKGKGASADEVGSAKLIGMDLGLTGEIEEISQGSEPDDFWRSFGPREIVQWSPDWNQRAKNNSYPTVMYRVDHERPGVLGSLWGLKRASSPSKGQAVKATCQKIEPFSQHDLETTSIHVLDAYRNFYILINNQCLSRGPELVTSMYLVHDLAMLSPSIQDRPSLPRCYVVIGEPTPDVKACFRKWSAVDGYSTGGKDSLCVTLEEAMEALGL